MFTRRRQNVAVPEVGADAPEFNLPSAQGGQLRLSMRTARGPVVVVFFRGVWSEEDVEYFQTLAAKEDEINLAAASVVGIGLIEPDEAREYVRPAVFIVGTDHKVAHAWTDGRPAVDEIMAKVTGITGLPKPPEEEEAKPEEAAEGGEKPKKMSAEERERIKAERRAAREAGKSVKSAQPEKAASSEEASAGEKAPKKMSKEERERIKAERRAAREAGKSLKKPEGEQGQKAGSDASDEDAAPPAEATEPPETESESAEEEPRDKARED